MRPRSDTWFVWTGPTCTYGCPACPIDPAAAPAGLDADALGRGLADLPETARRLIVLVGGEPFLRRDFLRLAAVIRAAHALPGLVTTGGALVYPQIRDRLRRAGLSYLRVQLFGAGEIHDRMTGCAGSFERALAGVRAWRADAGMACDVDVALTVRGRSSEGLGAEIARLADALADPDVQVILAVDPPGVAAEGLWEQLRTCAAGLADWNADPTRPLVTWETSSPHDVPLGPSPISRIAPRFLGTVPAACCLGTLAQPLGRQASAPVHPNSFNYIRGRVTVPLAPTAETCTAHAAAAADDARRHLWLIEGDQLVAHATDTGDFDGAAIGRIKDDYSHLFVDRSPPGVLDDFTEGMRRVLPDPVCSPCANRDRCGRRFAVVEGAPFAREERWIRGHLATLRGRVLDVGCGEQLYRDVLAPLLRSRRIDYTGLDPDDVSLATARAALPQGRFVLGGIEAFSGERGSYEHVLCLRALNHVADLDEALSRMAELLAPDGSLLIVETTPFALLRTPEQVEAADRAPRAGHQHFRNVRSEEILPLARRHALRVVTHRPATFAHSNEWVLLLRHRSRPAAAAAGPAQAAVPLDAARGER